MAEFEAQNLVYSLVLLGAILAMTWGAFARDWSKTVRYLLIWVAIFVGLFLVAQFFGLSLPND